MTVSVDRDRSTKPNDGSPLIIGQIYIFFNRYFKAIIASVFIRNGIRPCAQTFGVIDRDRIRSLVDRPSLFSPAIAVTGRRQISITSTNTLAKIRFFILYSPLHLFSPQQDHQTLFLLQKLQKKKAGSRFWHFWEQRYKYTTHLLWLQGLDGIFVGFL